MFSRPNFPSTENLSWKQGDVGQVSQQFFYRAGNNSDRLLLQSRAMMATLGISLCLLIFFCSKQLFGRIGGLISELIAVFDPNLLAHGALVTSDTAAAFSFLAVSWSYWRLLYCVDLRRLALSALSVAALFLDKVSAPAFLFMAAILAVIYIFSGESITIQLGAFKRIAVKR